MWPTSRFPARIWLVTLLLAASLAHAGTLSTIGESRWVHVAFVIDGDTFVTREHEKIRLLGINAPEIAHHTTAGQPLGRQATTRLRRLLGGRLVRLELDRGKKDDYGRTLAHVYLRDGTWVNAWMIEQGLAHVYLFAPNFRHAEKLLAMERKARRRKLGIWKLSRYKVLPAEKVNIKQTGQYRLLAGRWKKIHRWHWRMGRLHLSVPPAARRWFDEKSLPGDGRHVMVRGVIHAGKHHRLYMNLYTPYDLELLP